MDLVHTHRTAPRAWHESLEIILEGRASMEFWNDLEIANPDYEIEIVFLGSISFFFFFFSLLRNLETDFPSIRRVQYFIFLRTIVVEASVYHTFWQNWFSLPSMSLFVRRHWRAVSMVANGRLVYRVVIAYSIRRCDAISRTFIHFNDEVINCTFERRALGFFRAL